MRLQVVSIYDVKMQEYSGIYLVKTLEVAVRMFADTVNAPESQIGNHAEDFTLRKVGDFDTDTGELVACPPSIVMAAAEVVRRSDRDPTQLELHRALTQG